MHSLLVFCCGFVIYLCVFCLLNIISKQEMITKKQPWRGLQGVQIIIAVAKENTRLKIPRDCDPILRNILLSVWKTKPEKRY